MLTLNCRYLDSGLAAGLGISFEPGGFQCVLHLPHGSHYIEPIVGPTQPNKKTAKCSVALKVCA